MNKLSVSTVRRLIQYRKILEELQYKEIKSIYSHELANFIGGSSAQVRRDFMDIGYSGTPANGYNVVELKDKISSILDNPEGENIAIIGVGKLGRVLLEYCYWRFNNLAGLTAFDVDEDKVGKKIHDVNVYHISQLSEIIRRDKIKIVILAVPAEVVKDIARKAILAGVRGILNYSSVILDMPPQVNVENIDLIMSLEKASFFSRKKELLFDD